MRSNQAEPLKMSTAVRMIGRIAAAAAATASLGSCLFLSPDGDSSRNVHVVIRATAADAYRVDPGDAAKAPPCRTAADYLAAGSDLSAIASVWRIGKGTEEDVLVDQTELEVARTASDAVLVTGDFQIAVDQAGADYRLDVSLLARGQFYTQAQPGQFAGTLELDSGLSVHVDLLSFAAGTSSGTPGSICLSAPDVGGVDPACFQFQVGTVDPLGASVSATYKDTEFQFDDQNRDLRATLAVELLPISIYEGSLPLAGLVPGQHREETVPLRPMPSVPGSAGERARGTVRIELVDQPTLVETGVLQLERTVSLCP